MLTRSCWTLRGEGAAAGERERAAAGAATSPPPSPPPSCTTSIAFVSSTLFPFAADRLAAHLAAAWGSRELADDVAALAAQSAADVAAQVAGAAEVAVGADAAAAAEAAAAAGAAPGSDADARARATAAVAANVAWQMRSDRKTGALKQLQGHIWRAGYAAGELRGHVFEDVPGALKSWASAGLRTYIYSSGSREAQRLLFGHSAAGDLRPLLAGFFDTAVGPKTAAASYADIALTLGVDAPGRILFLTDALLEAQAARAAGLRVAVTDRPGNAPLPSGHSFRVVTSLSEALRL